MTDILLIQPPIRDFYLTAKRTIPYGLISIASALRKEGFSVSLFDALATSKSKVVDLPDEMGYLKEYYGRPDVSPFALFHNFRHYGYSFEHIGNMAKRSGAFLVGISSLFTAYSDEAIKTVQAVKKSHPDCKTVLGGHHPTSMPESAISHPEADFLIRGEGESAFVRLAKALQKGKSVSDIEGLVYRKPSGTIHISKPAVIKNLSGLDTPAFDLIDSKFYSRKDGGSAVIMTSRGCPMKCSYCCVGASSLPYRRKSVAAVLEELDISIRSTRARFIDFEDENLTLDKKWFHRLMDEIIKRYRGLNIELRAMNGLFPPSLDDAIILKMKKAGFRTLNLSLGSTSKSQLERFNRPDVRASLEKAMETAERAGLETVCYIIAGAPGQTADDSLEDLIYLARKPAIAGLSIYYPAPGSMDFTRFAPRGVFPDSLSLFRSSAIPVSDTTTRLESVTLLRLSRIVNFIKHLKKNGITVPSPSGIEIKTSPPDLSREEKGVLLLSRFLHDGIIRGISPDGEIYDHRTELRLTERFKKKV